MQLLYWFFIFVQLFNNIHSWFCSAYCKPNACSGAEKTYCADCEAPFVLSGRLCQVDTFTGYTLVAQNTSMSVSPTISSGNCTANYLFLGPMIDTQIVTLTTTSPISTPHMKIKFIVWVILINKWKSNDIFTVTNTNTGIFVDTNVYSYNTSEQLCGADSDPQSYFKFSYEIAHTDTTTNVGFVLQMKHTPGGSSTPYWGIKQYMILALGCHPYCLTCTDGLKTTCSACKTGYKLSGSTCQSTCLTGYGSTTNTTLCILCDLKCKVCYQSSTNCSSCTDTVGANQAYLYGTQCLTTCPPGYTADQVTHTCLACTNTACLSCSPSNLSLCYDCNTTTYWYEFDCVNPCPDGYFQDVQNCTKCDASCQICSNTPSPCTQCASGNFLYIDQCLGICPGGYFGYVLTRTCLDCVTDCATATIAMSIPSTRILHIDITFNHPIDFSTFPYTTFQSITISDPTITLSDFSISYSITSDRSYQVQLQPISNTFSMSNVTFTTDINYYATPFFTSDGFQISPDTYDLAQEIIWEVPQIPADNTWELKGLEDINNQINGLFTQPWVQEIKKTGVFALLLPGSQLSSTVLLHNATPSAIMYEGSRFWGTFVYFEVPQWEKDGSGLKCIFNDMLKTVLNSTKTTQSGNRRLLVAEQQLDWRFVRTGHVGYFLLDAYIPMIMVVLSWVPILILHKSSLKSVKARKWRGHFYTILHRIHQICMFYLIMGICLDWMYFQNKTNLVYKYLSLGFSILFLVYCLIYQIHAFYKIIPYTYTDISSHKFNGYVQKYAFFLRDIRYQEYGIYNGWSCSHFLRPYNYNILSFFRLCLILACLPLFQSIAYGCISCLILIQTLQICRFLLTWPYYSNWRNYYKLFLQVLLFLIFVLYLICDIEYRTNMSNTDISWMKQYKDVGWAGLVVVFVYNILYFLYFVVDLLVGCRYTNRQRMESARTIYYRNLLEEYQTYRDVANPTLKQSQAQTLIMESINSHRHGYMGLLSTIHQAEPAIDPISTQTQKQRIQLMAHRGNLVDHDYQKYWRVKVKIQQYQLRQAGQAKYTISYQKIKDLYMHLHPDPSRKYNIIMPQRNVKQVKITPHQNQYYFKLVDNIYRHYKTNTTQAVVVKTYLKIDQNLYQPGERIDIQFNDMNQEIQVRHANGEVERQVLKSVLRGFPVPDELLVLL